MLKQLVRMGKVLPNRFFMAIGLLLCLSAQSASAAQDCDCPCAKGKKQAGAAESPTGQVTILWPRQDNILARALHSRIEVQIDTAIVGTVDFDAPLTVSVPNGPHKLVVRDKSSYLENITSPSEIQITVSAQKPLYFQIINNGLSETASELDAATALAMLPASNGTNLASGPGTIYLYWPKMGLSLGLLDNLNTDLPVLLDGRRIGAFTNGDYLVVKAPSGEHVLSLDMSLTSGELIRKKLILGAGSTRYFHVTKGLEFHITEDSPAEAGEFAGKGLRQREALAQ